MSLALPTTPTLWLTLDKCRLPYWRVGKGPDLIFVHGWPLDSRTWLGVVEQLKEHFTCHLFDLPGAGQSTWEDDFEFTLQNMGVVTAQAIAAMPLKGHRVGLLGQDSGGSFVRMAAPQVSSLCGMALANTEIPGYHSWRLRVLLAMLHPTALHGLWRRLFRSTLLQRMVFADAVMNPRLAQDLGARFVAPLTQSPKAFSNAMLLVRDMHLKGFDVLAEFHPQITAPVKLIWGAQDPWFPLHQCETMLDGFGGPVELVKIPNAKLLVHEEHPARFAQETRAHFQACFGLEAVHKAA